MHTFALLILGGGVLVALVLGAGLVMVHRKSQAAVRRLAQDSHDRALALDQRFDVMESRQRLLEQRQALDHLSHLVDRGAQESRWQEDTTQALRDYVSELRGELERRSDTD